MDPRRNVELKARDPDPARTLAAALAHGAVERGALEQVDTYFAAPRGRLKLREERGGAEAMRAQLIAYDRADQAEARTSSYRLVDVPDPAGLIAALDDALGIVVVVRKRRRLLLWEDVRIHLDDVDRLGSYVELEAVAGPDSDLVIEHARVAELREVLGMTEDRVTPLGYAALLVGADATEHGFAGTADE